MKNNFIFSVLIIIVFFLGGFFLITELAKNHTPENIKYVKIAGQNIKVDLALTNGEQELGLSGRKSLNENEGMLFVFNLPGKYPFWMKDMNFPIDIIWLAPPEAGVGSAKVVYIKKNALPELYPETYGPGENDENAKYVLEVMAGFSDKNNLKIGDSVTFSY